MPNTILEERLEEKLLKSEKLVKNLQIQVSTLSEVINKQDRYAKTLECENVDLRNRILSVNRIRHGRDRVSFDLDVQQFMMLDGKERDGYITEAVIDAVHFMLNHATRTAHLETLRRKRVL